VAFRGSADRPGTNWCRTSAVNEVADWHTSTPNRDS
jgi:hypothetical protein